MSLIQPRRKKRNKYNAIKTLFDGVLYDSKMEATYAGMLKLRERGREIKGWDRQIWIPLSMDGGVKPLGHYVMDFVIYHLDGSTEWVEVKGFPTALWRLKWKMLESMYPDQKKTVVTKKDLR